MEVYCYRGWMLTLQYLKARSFYNKSMNERNMKIFGMEIDTADIKSPYQLYRKMRPEYFSDSHTEKAMGEDMFRFYMSNLSKDMKQDQFEEMTKQMVGKLVTPNLIPSTGPAGGGDGKTDLETYSVDDAISEKWYYSDACKGNEKWAFAISCKEDWKAKIQSDVQKIVGTGRGFNKIYFCTNQLVSSKNRADLYDKYKADYSVDVSILDLNWYKQAVFKGGCYDIAIKTLNLDDQLKEVKVEGAGDKRKREKLAEIDKRIDETKVNGRLDTAYVDDLLAAAILSRELELPKIEIKGRFSLALDQARKYGTSQQEFNVIYQIGWTSFYWFEDPEEMYQQYLQLKDMLQKEINPIRIEKCYNLYNLVNTAIVLNLFQEELNFQNEEKYWNDLFQKLSEDGEHKSSYLYLKISRLETQIINSQIKGENIAEPLVQLRDALKEVPRHIDISFEMHAEIIRQIGSLVSDNPVFEEIVDMVADQSAKRHSEISSAEVHFTRGVQNLEKNDNLNAIRHFGKCIIGFQKEETKGKLVQAAGMLAFAYKGFDLMYSAKNLFVKALSLMFHKIETDGLIDHLIITVLFELCRHELRVGNINAFINWLFLLDRIVAIHPSFMDDFYYQQRQEIDSILAVISLASPCSEQEWSMMPDICKHFELVVSKDTILYRLGYEEKTSQEFKDVIMADPKCKEHIAGLVDSSISLFKPFFTNKKISNLKTLVNGCTFVVTFYGDEKCQVYAEMLLSFIESFLATMNAKDIAIAFPKIEIVLKVKNSGKTTVKKGSKTTEYKININQVTATEQDYWNLCTQFLAFFLTLNSQTINAEEMFDKKNVEDGLRDRLVILSNYQREFKLVFNSDYKIGIEQWWLPKFEKYPNKNAQNSEKSEERRGKQANQIITDLIDYPLWDKALWSGCGYMMPYDGSEPPIILLMFKHYKHAKGILEKWESDYRAKKLNLKLTFIKGVDTEHPMWYKVIIAPDLKKIPLDSGRYVVATSRFHLMQAKDSRNLDMFERLYSKYHFAGISAVEIDNALMSSDPEKRYPHVIPVTNIEFREAWTIGENDPDSMAILPTDRPVIPNEHENDAPVLKLIEVKKKKYGKL